MANFKNLAFGIVRTPPSPPASGTTVVLEAGHGARFPALPFAATVWPVTVMPDPLTAEVVLVTAILNDTLTIVRAHEGTTARAILPGDQLAGTITEAYLATLPSKEDGVVDWAGSHTIAGDLSVAGATDLQTLAVHGPLTATDLTVAANATVGGELAVTGGAVINGSAVIGGGLNVSGNAALAGDLTVAGSVQGQSVMSPAADANAYANRFTTTINKAGSGTHALFAGTRFDIPAIGAAASALTEAATVYIEGAPATGTNPYALHVASGAVRFDGPVVFAGSFGKYRPVSANATAVAGDRIVVTANTPTISLPAASANPDAFVVVLNNGTGLVTIIPNGTDKIGLAISQTLNVATATAQGDSLTLVSDGISNWHIV